MSIDGIANSISVMMVVKPASGSNSPSRTLESGNTGMLTPIDDEARLSSLNPKLRAMLDQISEQGGNVLESLERNVSLLQDGFMEKLDTKLQQADISRDDKLTLRLDNTARLQVAGDHPQREKVNSILAESTELSETFHEISSQSELIRDISNIRKVISHRSGVARYAEEAASTQGASVYQISMKGAMSHFYFSHKG